MSVILKIWNFYAEGFREMKLGKTLWSIILIKLFIMFVILRVFFFADFLGSRTESDAEIYEYVGTELIGRQPSDINISPDK